MTTLSQDSYPSSMPNEGNGSPTTGPLDLSKYISGVTDRAYKNWGRADDQYKWAQDTYNKDRAVTDRVVNRGLDTQDKFAGYADQDRAFWEGTYKPAMQRQMDYATQYGSPERMAANRAGAISQSNIAQQGAANAARQTLLGYGVDPSSGRYAGLDAGLAANRAMHAAAAGTKSDRDTELMGQQFLANAINTGATLPGQVANQAGVSMAAGNQAVNAGLATTASGSSTMGTPLQWGAQGNDMYNQWMKAAMAQTEAGQRANELELKREEQKSKESSGIGAALGAGAGILGMVGNFAMPGVGGVASSVGGNLLGSMFKSGKAEHGGLIRKMRAGGPVRPQDDDEPGEVHRGYRPGEDVDPQTEEVMRPRAWREPVDTSQWDPEMPDSDTNQTLDENHPELSLQDQDERNRRQWVPNYAQGGAVDGDSRREQIARMVWGGGGGTMPAFAEGGEVPEDDFVDTPEEEMPEGELMPEGEMPMEEEMPPTQGSNVVPPEASPSGGEETDDVHALLNEGEFVIPKDVVRWNGEKFFQKLIEKSYAEMKGPQVAEPEPGPPVQAMAISPPSFQSGG